ARRADPRRVRRRDRGGGPARRGDDRRGVAQDGGRRRRARPRRGDAAMNAPLADIRVLAVEQYGAGPWGTMQLADLGADVIKVEDPSVGGDVGRYVHPYQEGEDSLFFEAFNRNKRSISLDLRHPEARAVFEDVAASVDAVF